MLRTNITWRRRADADLSKWLVVPYIVFVALFAALQAAMLWIYDFKTGPNTGLGTLAIAMFGLWFRICLASPKGRPFDPDAFLAAEGVSQGPSGSFRHAITASGSAETSMRSTPVTVSARGPSNASGVDFGKRGRS